MNIDKYFITNPEKYADLIEVTAQMCSQGLPITFIDKAGELAKKSMGVFNLMMLWRDETDPNEKGEIIADISECIEDSKISENKILHRPKINFDDIPQMANEILAFKKKLRAIVDANGGIADLSQKTGMAIPSLSRFFNSASMPRKVTLYKIANALGLEERDIATEHVK